MNSWIKKIFAALIGLLFALVVIEGVIRASIAVGFTPLMKPHYYFSRLENEYWVLGYLKSQALKQVDPENPDIGIPANPFFIEVNPDPIVGWAVAPTEPNPLGAVTPDADAYDPDAGRPVLFYGDSFVTGKTPPDGKIPQILESVVEGVNVLNFGVPGYGVDQIYLRFDTTHGEFENPVILFGILTLDMERSMVAFRGSPKPHFTLDSGGELVYHPPETSESAEWVANHPLEVTSYVWRFWLRQLGGLFSRQQPCTEMDAMAGTIAALNGALIDKMVADAREIGAPVGFVIFHAPDQIGDICWQEKFLTEKFEELGVPYVDTGPLLQSEADARGLAVEAFYQEDTTGHPNEMGNALIAEAVARMLETMLEEDKP